MTRNQIAFWEHVETQRSNRARETEAHRANVAHETETRRHNLVSEAIGFGTLRESERHNQAYESELNRHNLESEQISRSQLAETVRHNVANENLGYYSADLNARTTLARTQMELAQSKYNADLSAATSRYTSGVHAYASMYGADFGYKAAQLTNETRRMELDQRRASDVWWYNEEVRHNKATEERARINSNLDNYRLQKDIIFGQHDANVRTFQVFSQSFGNLLDTIANTGVGIMRNQALAR